MPSQMLEYSRWSITLIAIPPPTTTMNVAVTITLAALRTEIGSRRNRFIRRSIVLGRFTPATSHPQTNRTEQLRPKGPASPSASWPSYSPHPRAPDRRTCPRFHRSSIVIGLPRSGALVSPRARPTVEQRRRQSKDATLKAKQEPASTPTRDRGLTCQLHFDLLASVKLLTELTTLAALVAIAATWVAEGLDGSALTAVWSASTDVLTAVV